jgi:hypothetical protein
MIYKIKIIFIVLIVSAVLFIVYQLINSFDDEDKLTIESFNTPSNPTIPSDYFNILKTDLATPAEIQNLAESIKQFNITDLQSYLPNVPPLIKDEISQLVQNYKIVQKQSQDDGLEYYSASKKYETKIQDAKAELKKLNESFANTNLEAPVNFNNMLDFRAFREIYVI